MDKINGNLVYRSRKVKRMRIVEMETIHIRPPIGIPLPELSMEQIEQLDEEHMSLEYCYDLLVLAYQKSREMNSELEALTKELRQDNDRLIHICRQNGLTVNDLIYP